ncbi:MAG: hypothetical protein MZU79_00660 [Anaerotruncus sp.]|nr:hypothetical protein [Anaerotruncus sp.]
MRKPVVLITGAGGEIGHGLISSLAAGRQPRRHHARREPARAGAGAGWCRASSRGRSSTPTCSTGSSPSIEVDLVFHLAALLSTAVGVHADRPRTR